MTLPLGDDFPDPNILGDPSSLSFIDPGDTTDITSLGLTLGATTPEPGTMALLGIAFAGLGIVSHRRRA